MKLVSLKCPNCNSNLEAKENTAFCEFCGAKLVFDDETVRREFTYIKRDEARIKEAEIKERMQKDQLDRKERREKHDEKIGLICGIGIPLFLIICTLIGFGINSFMAKQQGRICAGNASDYIGDNYEAVVMQFEEMGFTSIVTVDLKNAGLAFWKDECVESISINGKTDFESIHYFFPTDKVIISYH